MMGMSTLCVGLRQLVSLLLQRMLPWQQLGPRLPAQQLLPLHWLRHLMQVLMPCLVGSSCPRSHHRLGLPLVRLRQVYTSLRPAAVPGSCGVHGL